MAQFVLNWNNTALLAEANAIAQRALYRRRSVGGTYISAGFSPVNDLPKSATTTTSPVLLSNVAYQFKIQTLCTENGPTDNDNGVIEQIKFACINPIISDTDTTSEIAIDITSTDITKARFTLKKDSDDSILYGPTVIMPDGNSIHTIATGLLPNTAYYWQYELYAVINGVEKISSAVGYLNALCGEYPLTTLEEAGCDAPEDLVVTNE